jgi:hypothetical protein
MVIFICLSERRRIEGKTGEEGRGEEKTRRDETRSPQIKSFVVM